MPLAKSLHDVASCLKELLRLNNLIPVFVALGAWPSTESFPWGDEPREIAGVQIIYK
jgi:hypothetical protein